MGQLREIITDNESMDFTIVIFIYNYGWVPFVCFCDYSIGIW